MAAALHPPLNDTGPGHANLFQRPIVTESDFRDNRYPSLTLNPQRTSAMASGASDRSVWDNSSLVGDGPQPRRSPEPLGTAPMTAGWLPEHWGQADKRSQQPAAGGLSGDLSDVQSHQSQSQLSQTEPTRSAVSYALPPGAARRVVERYSLDNDPQRATPSRASEETRPTAVDSAQDPPKNRSGTPQAALRNTSKERPSSLMPSTPRHPSLPAAGIGASSHNLNGTSFHPPIMPLSASPGYTPPVSPKHRVYAQQPTYITPTPAPNPINPVFSPTSPVPQEEICLECAMRDQDMADVDVTSPGVWDRESDVHYNELLREEQEEEVTGAVNLDEASRPRATGDRLTEQNLKIWLSMVRLHLIYLHCGTHSHLIQNPKEPASRQQNLNAYIKVQRTLLEAEALARARAMQEAKQLDNRMRDTYSQLRRSAYDAGTSPVVDDSAGVRIKPPTSPTSPNLAHARSQSREITLLQNGMIVEHVDVRREEREARERKRREERRARKSSRSSGIDVTSIISAQSVPLQDSGLGLKPYSRYSQGSSGRPISVLTAPLDRPDLPRTQSQASFSDVHSMGSASPRRTRFFGFKNLSEGWRSRDSLTPSGMSGSMVDMQYVVLFG